MASYPDNRDWVWEQHQDIVRLGFRVDRVLFRERSPFQRVEIVQSVGHGNLLLNDGVVMLSERDEFVYHEMIAHVPLCVHPAPRRVLIVGGGDAGSAREVLKHRSVERVVLVEIDAVVVEACRRYLPWSAAVLADPRLELVIEDGIRYVQSSRERFDVVILDSSDPEGPAAGLFERPFYRQVASHLNGDGILVTQAESPFYDQRLQRRILGNQRPFFDRLHLYLYSNLTYPGGLWGFGFASQKHSPLKDFLEERVEGGGLDARYYNAAVHRAAFMLPNFAAENLAGLIDPLD
jgi:spermidine synthase